MRISVITLWVVTEKEKVYFDSEVHLLSFKMLHWRYEKY